MELPLELPGPTPLSSPSASEDTPKGLSQQLSKWFAGSTGDMNPIEQLARFLQKAGKQSWERNVDGQCAYKCNVYNCIII